MTTGAAQPKTQNTSGFPCDRRRVSGFPTSPTFSVLSDDAMPYNYGPDYVADEPPLDDVPATVDDQLLAMIAVGDKLKAEKEATLEANRNAGQRWKVPALFFTVTNMTNHWGRSKYLERYFSSASGGFVSWEATDDDHANDHVHCVVWFSTRFNFNRKSFAKLLKYFGTKAVNWDWYRPSKGYKDALTGRPFPKKKGGPGAKLWLFEKMNYCSMDEMKKAYFTTDKWAEKLPTVKDLYSWGDADPLYKTCENLYGDFLNAKLETVKLSPKDYIYQKIMALEWTTKQHLLEAMMDEGQPMKVRIMLMTKQSDFLTALDTARDAKLMLADRVALEERLAQRSPWQITLMDLLAKQNDRQIFFVIDNGHTGKGWLQELMLMRGDTLVLDECETMRDIASAWRPDEHKYVLINMAKNEIADGKLNVTLLERLKDGRVFSSKYKSKVKRALEKPKVCVFGNEVPKRSDGRPILSKGRAKFFTVSKSWTEDPDCPLVEMSTQQKRRLSVVITIESAQSMRIDVDGFGAGYNGF